MNGSLQLALLLEPGTSPVPDGFVLLRLFADLSQYEIAARVGFSQMYVSRLQRRAIARYARPAPAKLIDLLDAQRARPANDASVNRAEGMGRLP